MNTNKTITLLLTEDEVLMLTQQAEQLQMSVSAVIDLAIQLVLIDLERDLK